MMKYLFFSYAVSVGWEREQAEQSGQPSESSGPIMERRSPLEDFNSLFCCCARRVGSMFFLLETKDGSPIVVAGPCWPFCTFVTTPLIVIFSGMVGYFIVSNPNTKLVRCFLQLYWFLFFQIYTHHRMKCILFRGGLVVVCLNLLPNCSLRHHSVILYQL
jgi:hypothetical protein